jgi:hypothetical protein
MVRHVEPEDLERQFEGLEGRLRSDFKTALAKLAKRQADESQELWRSLNALANEQRDLVKSHSRMTEELRQVTLAVEQVEDQLSSVVNALSSEHKEFAKALARLEERLDRLTGGAGVETAGSDLHPSGVMPVRDKRNVPKK